MYRSMPQNPSNKRVFGACLLSFLMLIAPMASVGAAVRRATMPVAKAKVSRTLIESGLHNTVAPEPVAPLAPSLSATLSDNTLLTVKKNPGDQINYTATITNSGAASPADDALAVIFNAPLDSNTTLVGGSIHASPIAFNDSYNWVGNTVLDTSARSLPSITANDVALTDAITLNTTPASGPAQRLSNNLGEWTLCLYPERRVFGYRHLYLHHRQQCRRNFGRYRNGFHQYAGACLVFTGGRRG